MVGEYGEVLLDWESQRSFTALSRDSRHSRLDPRTPKMVGTPVYLAPELIKGAEQLRPTADIYSLGMILYEILSGKHPFVGQSPHQIILNAIQGKYPKLRTNSDTDPFLFEGTGLERHRNSSGQLMSLELIKLCEAATEINPELRLPTADLFVSTLKNWLQGHEKQSTAKRLIERADQYTARIQALKIEHEKQLREVIHTEVIPLKTTDAIKRNEQSLKNQQLEQEQLLYAALYQDPHNELAHAALAHIYAEKSMETIFGNNTSLQNQVEKRVVNTGFSASIEQTRQHYLHAEGLESIYCARQGELPHPWYTNGTHLQAKIEHKQVNAGVLSKDLKPGSYFGIACGWLCGYPNTHPIVSRQSVSSPER